MSTKRPQLEGFRKSLLNRVTAHASFLEYIENCLAREDEEAKHSFHKIMVHNWSCSINQLLDTLTEYLKTPIIAVMYVAQGDFSSFYTSSLSVILKIIRVDFMFPFQRNMYNIDILFNDKSSSDCFDTAITIEDIVTGVVSRRFSSSFELDLTDFCNDKEFTEKHIQFYKINLLSHFKILMIRMGRDTKSLNLSNNNLTQVPVDILNFFMKGELLEINFSHNNIASLSEVVRVTSRVERLWLEGNPLCDEMDSVEYVKNVTMKFPRLMELDGVKLNQNGLVLPAFKNFLVVPDKRTRMIVEKFLALYFSHYDSNRKKVATFYDESATLSLIKTESIGDYFGQLKPFHTRNGIVAKLCQLARSVHDPQSFQVDVLIHDKKSMMVVIDGIYKELNTLNLKFDLYFQFRRTFVFNITTKGANALYVITNEMFSINPASKLQIQNSFQNRMRNLNDLALINADPEECEAICKAFMHLTQLRRSEAEARLRVYDWDIRKAILLFISDMTEEKISQDKFVEDDDFSDSESLISDDYDID